MNWQAVNATLYVAMMVVLTVTVVFYYVPAYWECKSLEALPPLVKGDFESVEEYVKIRDLSLCLQEREALLYGSENCGWTERQKMVFGEWFGNVPYISCITNETVCEKAGIVGYPAWEINGELSYGLKTPKKLAEMAGCNF